MFDDSNGRVGDVNTVQSLPFLGRVAAIVIPGLPLRMDRLGESAPSPEIGTVERLVPDHVENMGVIPVTADRCRFAAFRKTVTWESEFLNDDGESEPQGDESMLADIFISLRNCRVQCLLEAVRTCPSPVIGSYMDGHVIYSRNRIDTFHEFRIVLAPHQAFISG